MAKGTISRQIKCAVCGSTVLEVPDNATDSTIINCENGHRLGPLDALSAELAGEAHTVILGGTTVTTFKPVK